MNYIYYLHVLRRLCLRVLLFFCYFAPKTKLSAIGICDMFVFLKAAWCNSLPVCCNTCLFKCYYEAMWAMKADWSSNQTLTLNFNHKTINPSNYMLTFVKNKCGVCVISCNIIQCIVKGNTVNSEHMLTITL